MSEKASRKGDKREAIVEAAIEVFAQKGFHAARISDVARAAGVADGTIYLYFDNKEHLLLSIFEEKMEFLRVGLLAAIDGVDCPLERVRVFARFHWDYLRVFEQIVREGQSRGVMRADVDPFLAKWAFFGALDELGQQYVLSRRERISPDAAAEQVADIFLRGMATPAASPR